MGTTDITHHTNPVAFALVSDAETNEAFTFAVNAVKTAVKYYIDINYIPHYVISDGCDAIFGYVKKVFNNGSQDLICFRHLREAVRKQLNYKGVKKEDRVKFLDHLNFMQRHTNK
jgi:hypothetical protein